MPTYPFPEAAPAHAEQPFHLETRMILCDRERGDLRPAAYVLVNPYLRTSGLLAQLTDGQAKLLLAMLTFVTPNGVLTAVAEELALALGIAVGELRRRLAPLLKPFWQGEPLLRSVALPEGGERYTLSAAMLGHSHLPTTIDLHPKEEKTPPTPAGREAVLQASRERYNQPREVVEQIVREQLGVRPEETADTTEARLWRGLRDAGLPRETVDALLEEYGHEACQRQLEWLPLREAKNPARYLAAAIKDNYGPPRGSKALSTEEEYE
ncbi:MAG: hypothetical protein QM758_13845 [Armatimonas sp.]